jgi:hypothetical protein
MRFSSRLPLVAGREEKALRKIYFECGRESDRSIDFERKSATVWDC